MQKFTRTVEGLSEWVGNISVYLVILAVALGFYNVVVRYVGQIIGVQLSFNTFIELQWHLFALVFILSFPYILKNNINVRVDFIYGDWPDKRKALLDFWGHILFLIPFCVLGIVISWRSTWTAWGRGPRDALWTPWAWTGSIQRSPDPGGLIWAPIKTMIIIGFVLLLLQAIAEIYKLQLVLRGKMALGEVEPKHNAPIRIE